MILKRGSSDLNTNGEVSRWWDFASRYAKSYAFLLGKRDGYYGNDEGKFTSELQRRLGIPITGEFGDVEALRTGYKWGGTSAPPVFAHRPIWIYSAPGSGVPWNVGPPFDVGQMCKDILHINHQPIGYPIGGYLGFMGGDPTNSYLDVIGFQKAEMIRMLQSCPDLNDPKLELWYAFYSQSADGGLDAMEEMFGDGGEFAHLRSHINGAICFGNPATQGTGIARKVHSGWLNALTRNINHPNDFYAVAPDHLRPIFYHEIVQAEISLPFFIHILKLAIPAFLNFTPIIGGIAGPLAPMVIAGAAGIGGMSNVLGGLMEGVLGPSDPVDAELEKMLSLQGLLTSFPDLIGLIAALPGLQAHGSYDPMLGYDIVARFRR